MSETSTLNACSFGIATLSTIEQAKDSAAVGAHMAHIAMQADDHNMHEMRNAFSRLARVFTDHAIKLTEQCIHEEQSVNTGETSH